MAVLCGDGLFQRHRKHDDGYWYRANVASVSYPSEGHDACRNVEGASFWFRHRNEVIGDAVKRHEHNGVFVDVGGGNGHVAAYLVQNGFQCAVLEPGEAGARNAAKRGLNVFCGTLEDAGFEPSSIPAFGLFDVIEHVADDRALLSSARKALRQNGLVFVTVPALPALWSGEDDYAGHVRRYTRASLNDVLTRAGLRVLRSSYFFAPLVLPVALLRALPYRLGRKSHPARDMQAQHESNGRLAFRVVERLLARERRLVASGGEPFVGTSILGVATGT